MPFPLLESFEIIEDIEKTANYALYSCIQKVTNITKTIKIYTIPRNLISKLNLFVLKMKKILMLPKELPDNIIYDEIIYSERSR